MLQAEVLNQFPESWSLVLVQVLALAQRSFPLQDYELEMTSALVQFLPLVLQVERMRPVLVQLPLLTLQVVRMRPALEPRSLLALDFMRVTANTEILKIQVGNVCELQRRFKMDTVLESLDCASKIVFYLVP